MAARRETRRLGVYARVYDFAAADRETGVCEFQSPVVPTSSAVQVEYSGNPYERLFASVQWRA